jgi:hypothetical protein
MSGWPCITGRDSSVGITTRYMLDGPGIKSQWGQDFPHASRLALGPTQPPIQWVLGLSGGGGVKRPGRGVDHPPPSSAGVKERVELYLCFPSGPSWPVLGWTLLIVYYGELHICSVTAHSYIQLVSCTPCAWRRLTEWPIFANVLKSHIFTGKCNASVIRE